MKQEDDAFLLGNVIAVGLALFLVWYFIGQPVKEAQEEIFEDMTVYAESLGWTVKTKK